LNSHLDHALQVLDEYDEQSEVAERLRIRVSNYLLFVLAFFFSFAF